MNVNECKRRVHLREIPFSMKYALIQAKNKSMCKLPVELNLFSCYQFWLDNEFLFNFFSQNTYIHICQYIPYSKFLGILVLASVINLTRPKQQEIYMATIERTLCMYTCVHRPTWCH